MFKPSKNSHWRVRYETEYSLGKHADRAIRRKLERAAKKVARRKTNA